MSQITRIGIDLAKNIFQLCAVDLNGMVVYNKIISRKKRAEKTYSLLSRSPRAFFGRPLSFIIVRRFDNRSIFSRTSLFRRLPGD